MNILRKPGNFWDTVLALSNRLPFDSFDYPQIDPYTIFINI